MARFFSVDPATGKVKTVYTFLGGANGAVASGPLLPVGNTLYGVAGGGSATVDTTGCGIIYSDTA